jgi:hypothetical protein
MHPTSCGTGALLLALAAFAFPCAAQTVSGDTTRKAQPDTAARAPADTATKPKPDSAAASKPAAAPVDSALARACTQSGGVLVVIFRANATPAERTAAVKAAGATIAGAAGGADGAYYVQVPGGGANAAADRLIRMEPVRGVSGAPCPPG